MMLTSRRPHRSLELAVRFARIFGGTLLLLGFLGGVLLLGDDDMYTFVKLLVIGVVIFPVVLVPGALYLVFALAMTNRKRWAIITVLVFASVHTACFIILPVLVLTNGGAVGPPLLLLTGGLLLLSCLLIIYCVQALPIVDARSTRSPGARGFEPVLANSVQGPSFPVPPRALKPAPPTLRDKP